MPRFSLIVATKGRTDELERLLQSLAHQDGYKDFELIVVDQNPDDRLVPVLSRFSQDINCSHLRCGPGVSKARNMGLSACRGELIAFPDDDCWYPPETLKNIDSWFTGNPGYGILSVTVRDEDGVKSANKWKAESCDLAPINIFRTSATYTFFVRSSDWKRRVFFDETLGPASGTLFGSGEDTDFVLSLMSKGVRGRFTSVWHVGHPRRDMFSGHIKRERALSYGMGMGRVLRKHSLLMLGGALFGFDLFRTFKGLLTGRANAGILCWAHGQGILRGYLAKAPRPSAAVQAA
ncbi:glycosyltransferase [Acidipila rosea]|uniref:Glycosyltransferase involved in cell wall biosynthesis n=1 Tax=Acidipila rosea TaxID=768535 RepID=A0A4R1LDK1_9BACT|nr:glycosyltransferase family 2 protein [Acidipila rosea]MBW4025918.1 glycosyltransferase family 2 protein [Acidobacteriota bacterium]MBW4044163.1 glycosyltransferase family 2 protein [Acidobacteriota bacterium]TCK75807.1 glycosyltransferase involved in cell wall biosynthesis [Acidipila rosea]